MIKVDHAGENGAVNIYRAQRMIARVRSTTLIKQLDRNFDHEKTHRQIFDAYLQRNQIRKCQSYWACGIGGYTLGIVTGLIGPSAVAATTYAVEHVVLEHFEEQLAYLETHDDDAFNCVQQIIADEKTHHDEAKSQMNADLKLTKILISFVQFCTESVIRFGMR
ncbi:MAG: demethoxyubiquinone hydroxylase family protein [Proteobacteria bacterium]|nr:demethoxyubiquinone hydroxylase family protein [Pseudomonadota bacterium]